RAIWPRHVRDYMSRTWGRGPLHALATPSGRETGVDAGGRTADTSHVGAQLPATDMRHASLAGSFGLALVLAAAFGVFSPRTAAQAPQGQPAVVVPDTVSTLDPVAQARWEQDLAAMERFRPGYPFWQHIFAIPDGSIAFG